MSEAKREQSFQELLAEIQAEAARFCERVGRPRLKLLKGGLDSQELTSNDKKCPPITAAMRSKASRAMFRNGLVLLSYEGERDKSRNGLAVIQRNRLKLIKGGKLTQQDELRILAFMAEWDALQELKRLRGET